MRTCFSPGCRSGYKTNTEKHHLFRPKSYQVKQWGLLIPRSDRVLSTKSYICDIHFSDHFIRKVYTHIINGKVVEIERGKWDLTADAKPTIFPNTPKYLSKKLLNRKPPKERLPIKEKAPKENTTNNNTVKMKAYPLTESLINAEPNNAETTSGIQEWVPHPFAQHKENSEEINLSNNIAKDVQEKVPYKIQIQLKRAEQRIKLLMLQKKKLQRDLRKANCRLRKLGW